MVEHWFKGSSSTPKSNLKTSQTSLEAKVALKSSQTSQKIKPN